MKTNKLQFIYIVAVIFAIAGISEAKTSDSAKKKGARHAKHSNHHTATVVATHQKHHKHIVALSKGEKTKDADRSVKKTQPKTTPLQFAAESFNPAKPIKKAVAAHPERASPSPSMVVSSTRSVKMVGPPPFNPQLPVRRAVPVQIPNEKFSITSQLGSFRHAQEPVDLFKYGEPYLNFVCRTRYGIGPKWGEDRDSRKYMSSTGPRLRLSTRTTPATGAYSRGRKGDILLDLQTGEVIVNWDTGGAVKKEKAARTNFLVRLKKIFVGGGRKHKYVVKRTYISLHKTKEQLGAPVLDIAKNGPLQGAQYGHFLVVPWSDARPFERLNPSEKEKVIASAVPKAKAAYQAYIRRSGQSHQLAAVRR